jgi:hypothetical protein
MSDESDEVTFKNTPAVEDDTSINSSSDHGHAEATSTPAEQHSVMSDESDEVTFKRVSPDGDGAAEQDSRSDDDDSEKDLPRSTC